KSNVLLLMHNRLFFYILRAYIPVFYSKSEKSSTSSDSFDGIYTSILFRAFSIIGSKSTLLSNFLTISRFGFVFGAFGLKIVQQSSKGRIEVSYVPMRLAMATISFISKVNKGLRTGKFVTSLIAYILVKV